MSVVEDRVEFGDRLVRLVDSGVSVREAAVAVGVSPQRCYRFLRAVGRGAGRGRVSEVVRASVVAVFGETGSICRAAVVAGCARATARQVLVDAGALPAERLCAPNKFAQKQRFLELSALGWSDTAAAREVGVHPNTGRDWRKGIRRVGNTRVHPDGRVVDYRTGTVYTRSVTAQTGEDSGEDTVCAAGVAVAAPGAGAASAAVRATGRLSLREREDISDGLRGGLSLRAIAARIGRNVTTVSREIGSYGVDGMYLPAHADRQARAARARPKPSKLVVNTVLRGEVEKGLARKLSPEQIAHRLRRDHPDDDTMWVSHETIYQAVYFQARGGLKREVKKALRTGRTRRKPHRKDGERTPRFVDPMVMISERPAEVEDRAVPGHWEGDLITGAYNKSAIGTLVERSTRYVMLLHLPHGHDAEQVRDALVATMGQLPEHLCGSLTWDQGAEMARHAQFRIATDIDVYFCDPASPWQRGTNENTNGLLRQYFPKGTDLTIHGAEDLEHVAQELNSRPRKTLNWDTPAERLDRLLCNQ